MRVALLIDTYGGRFLGGGQVHVRETTQLLTKRYPCQIDIYACRHAALGVRILWNLSVIPQVLWTHWHHPYQLIHAQAYSAGVPGKLLSFLLGIPIIYTVHGCNTLDIFTQPQFEGHALRQGLGNYLKFWIEKWLLTRIRYDQVISVAANYVAYPNINSTIVVIPNGVSVHSGISKRAAKRKRGTHLLFVGRLETIKGMDLLLHALAKVKDLLGNWQLYIVGTGREEASLKQLTLALGLSAHLQFLGKQVGKELDHRYQQADLFILPSLSEGQPLTLLEAWSWGLPVLVTRVGHNPWMVKNMQNGFLAKPSVEGLARALQVAMTHRVAWSVIGKRGRQLASQEYTWKQTAEQIFALYQKVLK